ncbi:MAG: ABC transporter permease [Pirellulales bacterium]|nr:ABC transporter permease [Pirellulales bacterium]
MNLLRTACIVARKDLRLYFRDRIGVLLGFLLPIVLMTVMGFIMKYAFAGTQAMPPATLWVADEDGSKTSRRLIELLREGDVVQVRPRAGEPPVDGTRIRQLVRDGDAHHGLILAPGFGKDLEEGTLPKVTMVRDPGRRMEDHVIQIGLVQAFMTVSRGRLWPAAMGELMRESGMTDENVERLIAAARGVNLLLREFAAEETGEPAAQQPSDASRRPDDRLPFELHDIVQSIVPIEHEDVAPPDRPRGMTYMLAQGVSGVIVMMLMFGMMACSTTLVQEREGGTLPRLLVAAVPRGAVFWGKFLFTMLVGMVQLAVLFAYGNAVFRIGAFRDPITLAVLSITWAAAATSFGMLIAAWARTTRQAEGLSTILILVMAAAGGCWFPIQMMRLPWAIDAVTHCTLTYWAMSGYQNMFWDQLSWTQPKMLTAIGVQWGFVAAAVLAAQWLYGRRYVVG